MAASKRFLRGSRVVCLAFLAAALASEGRSSTPSGAGAAAARESARVSLMVDPGVCKPGFVEAILNDWLVATKDSEFESDSAAMAFYGLVDFVYLLRDIAQEFCV